jgi:hypothetical protein
MKVGCAPSCFYGSNNHSNHPSRQAWGKCRLHNELRIVFARNEHAAVSKSFGPSRGQGTTQTIRSQGAGVPNSVRPSKACRGVLDP